jgi:NADH-quinone oxidoreductase subunit M
MLYERYHTRQIKDFGGMARKMPILACFMLLLTLSSIGLPGLNGFVGEFLLLLGMFQRAWTDLPTGWATQLRVISVLAVLGVVLGAWYMLHMVQRVFFGPQREPAREHDADEPPIRDLAPREILALLLLAVFIFWIGLKPSFFLDRMRPTLDSLAKPAMEAMEERTADASKMATEDKRSGAWARGPAPSAHGVGPLLVRSGVGVPASSAVAVVAQSHGRAYGIGVPTSHGRGLGGRRPPVGEREGQSWPREN